MTNAVPAIVAIILVCSLPGMALVAAGPATDRTSTDWAAADRLAAIETGDDETTSRLSVDGSIRGSHTSQSPDLATTLATQDDALRTDHALHDADYRWGELSSEEREAALNRTLEHFEQRVDEIDEREQALVADHVAGDVSDDVLLRSLVRHDRESRHVSDALRRLESLSREVPGYSLTVRSKVAVTERYQGPVRTTAYQTLSGSTPVRSSETVLFVTAADGAVVSTIDGGEFLREATRFDNRDPSLPNQYDQSQAAERFSELYPFVHANEPDSTFWIFPAEQLYRLEPQHDQGELVAYLDGGTGEIFRENQVLVLDALPKTSGDGPWENESLRLSVDETPRSGPIEVTVTDAETGEPVDASVVIDDVHVADTGADGTAWVLPPPGQYELTVEHDDRVVTATLRG